MDLSSLRHAVDFVLTRNQLASNPILNSEEISSRSPLRRDTYSTFNMRDVDDMREATDELS